MRLINPVGWRVEHARAAGHETHGDGEHAVGAPMLTLVNAYGNKLHVHVISDRLVRVMHQLPGVPNERQRHRHPQGRDGVAWEIQEGTNTCDWRLTRTQDSVTLRSPEGIKLVVDFERTAKLSWYWPGAGDEAKPFLADFKSAYQYCKRTGRMFHMTQRDSYLPLSEHLEQGEGQPRGATNEFIYGLGETTGSMAKNGRRYTVDARDSLGYDVEHTDPLYKPYPWYVVHNKDSKMWYGLYYNSLVPSVFDFGAEHDFSTGFYRSYTVEHGPLDYYVLLGASSRLRNNVASSASPPLLDRLPRPRLQDLISQFAALVTPFSVSSAGAKPEDVPLNFSPGWQASPSLPRLSSFGYLASSMTLSEQRDAQQAIEEYVRDTRTHGFAIDGMHLSSGYCLDESTGERMYFTWNKVKYPDPSALGLLLEGSLQCPLIINVKPWLLEGHPRYQEAAVHRAFVQAASDAVEADDKDTVGIHGASRTFHWSTSMGQTGAGSYIDFTSERGCDFWQRLLQEGVFCNNIGHVWLDNNECSTLIDDADRLEGDSPMWQLPDTAKSPNDAGHNTLARQVGARMGWSRGQIEVGAVGRAVLTMGMARGSWHACRARSPEGNSLRPVLLTRSAVPGIQAFAHATWSGDNSTTWSHLKYNLKMTLGMGMSFGPGLYGHDVGGFAGEHSPSPELLVRWCQQAMWHTRFVVHSWKKVSTTLFMFDDQPAISRALQSALQMRYRLVPMLYSLYATDYHRRGWPVIRPLLWNHQSVEACLDQDEQFLFGDAILVAPVLDAGAQEVTFTLPFRRDSGQPDHTDSVTCWWYDLHGECWLRPHDEERSRRITLQAPLDRCPILIRENGILLYGGLARTCVSDELARTVRILKLFPSPRAEAAAVEFTLIEDDGISDFTDRQTEIRLRCRGDAAKIYLQADLLQHAYAGSWTWHVMLPPDETRPIEFTGSCEFSDIEDDTGALSMRLIVR